MLLAILNKYVRLDAKYIHNPPHIAMDFDSIHPEVEVFPKVWLIIPRKDVIASGPRVVTTDGIQVVFDIIRDLFMLLNK